MVVFGEIGMLWKRNREDKDEKTERESEMCCEERGKVNKISIKNYGILVRTLLYLKAYCSMF